MTKVKICGITNHEDLIASIEFGADYVGFIVDLPIVSHREIVPELANELVSETPTGVATTMVTILEEVERTVDLFEQVGADVLQIHGDFTIELIEEISDMIDKKLVVSIDPKNEIVDQVADIIDAIVCDSQGERGAGGTGKTNDWDRVRELKKETKLPIILAGGLTPENVSKAIDIVDPFAVDVSSGVEGPGGLKNHEAIREFIRSAHKIGGGM
tara:strand:+ start:2278 stop:2919 length:642 start_codon:yes stop_codon:yes gene_type:complete